MTRKPIAPAWYDPRRGAAPVHIEPVSLAARPVEPPRTNCFRIYWIESGAGLFWADAARFRFEPRTLLFFVPYQHLRLAPEISVRGQAIQFHANFLCVETFHAETGCSGVLFNDPYNPPLVRVDRRHYHARMLGAQSRRPGARLSLPQRRRPVGSQRRHS